MTMIDNMLVFSDDQALTAIGNTAATNDLDLKYGFKERASAGGTLYGSRMDANPPMWLNVRCTTAFTLGTATGTVTPSLQGSVGGSTFNTILTGPSTVKPTAGALLWSIPIPAGISFRYYRVNYALTMSASVGKVFAALESTPPLVI